MRRVLPDRFWRAKDRKECANADANPGGLGGGRKNGLRTRRHGVLYCRRAGEGCQEAQRQYLPLSVGFAHRFLLGHAIIRFSGHAGTTADRAALCILIDQIPAKALYDIGDGSRRSRLIDICWVGTSNNRDFNRLPLRRGPSTRWNKSCTLSFRTAS